MSNEEEYNLGSLLPHGQVPSSENSHYLHQLPRLLDLSSTSPIELLDLGAGHGKSKKLSEKILGAQNVNWRGVDIDSSAEHLSKPEDAPDIDIYDGVNLPYRDASFDVVWSKQVLEHVRQPDLVIGEVSRVIKPGGLFIGSVSQLEPYHSRSIFNWTHYGIKTVLADHRLEVFELTPGADGLLLMLRALFGYDTGLNKFFSSETPFNQLIDAVFGGTGSKATPRISTAKRMATAGHIHFASRKT